MPAADLLTSAGAATVATGRRLGLYDAMARLESVTPLQLAMATDASAWFIEAWLQAQSSAGYAVFDPVAETYSLSCRLDSA